MRHQLHSSISFSETFLLSLPQPLHTSLLSDIPTAYSGLTKGSLDSAANVQNFIVNQVRPIKYGPVVESSQGTADMPAPFRSAWNDSWICQILPNEIPMMLPNLTKINKPMRCEVCRIDFNSKSVFDDHISGQEHKNMQFYNGPSNTVLSGTSNVNSLIQASNVQGQELFVDAGKDLESRKEKLSNRGEAEHIDQVCLTSSNGIGSKKIKVAQSARCEICMIVCNTKDSYVSHLSGKKHQRKLKKLLKSKSDIASVGADANASVAGATAVIITENCMQHATNQVIEPREKQDTSKQEGINSHKPKNAVMLEAPKKDIETNKRKCELEGGAATNPAIESQEKQDTSKQEAINSHKPENAVMLEAPKEVIETKKRKCEIESGAATTSSKLWNLSNVNSDTVLNLPDHPTRCEICLIKCNSKHAYNTHLSGKKHLRNVEKLSKTKKDGADASVVGTTAATVTANEMQLAMNPAIVSQEKLHTSKQEGINSHQPENAVMLEAPKSDNETKKRKCELEGGSATTSSKSCNVSNVNSKTVFNLPNHPTWCEICSIDYNSKYACITHVSGKKHLRNRQRLSKSKNDGDGATVVGTPAAIVVANGMQLVNPAIESQDKPDTSQQKGISPHHPENVVMLEAPIKDVETKKRKCELEGGAATTFSKLSYLSNVARETVFNLPGHPAWCEICSIKCDSKLAYITHFSGKKHLRRLEKLSKAKDDGADASVVGATAVIVTVNDTQQASNPAIKPQENPDTSQQEGINSHKPENLVLSEAPKKDVETKKRKHELEGGPAKISSYNRFNINSKKVLNLPDGPTLCEICLISCNSKHACITHLSGKKHLRNMEKLSAAKNDGAVASAAGVVAAIKTANDMQKVTNLAIEPPEDLNTCQQEGINSHKPEYVAMLEAPEKDIGTEKRKHELGGSATTFFKECSLCSVLCNSETVYNSHLEGKKHAAMVKKQATGGF